MNKSADASSGVPPDRPATRRVWDGLLLASFLVVVLVLWWLLYRQLPAWTVWMTFSVFKFPAVPGYDATSILCCDPVSSMPPQLAGPVRIGRGVSFLLFQIPNAFMLVTLAVFLMGIVRSFFTPERTRRILAGRRLAAASVLAALLGVVTPFCSCSAVPLFIGFVTAGIPVAVTFTFLTAAPLVNEIAVAMLWQTLGWRLAALYAGAGLTVAFATGWTMHRLRMERYLEDWVRTVSVAPGAGRADRLSWLDRIRAGVTALREVLGRVWGFILLGLVAGMVVHAFVPQDALVSLLGRQHWWSVPLAVAIGIPIYANTAAVVPVAYALLGRGIAAGTVVAFLMAVTALSLPEFIILRRVLKTRLLVAFAGVLCAGILAAGILFNLLAP